MKFSEIIYQRAENELRTRRQQAERLADMRRKEFIEKFPELIKIENDMKNAKKAVKVRIKRTTTEILIIRIKSLPNGII